MKSQYLAIRGHNLYLETYGQHGFPPVVLLHHGLGSTSSWKFQIPSLQAAGYFVVVFDRWGYGKSSSREALSVPCFEDDLDDIEIIMNHLGMDQAAWVGHSDGGTIALYLATQKPHRVSCIAVIASHIYVEPKMHTGILALHEQFHGSDRFRKGLERLHGEKTTQVFNNWFSGWVRPDILGWDMRSMLPQIQCPVWVVQGLEDEHATPQHAIDLADSIPGARLWLVENANHMLPQEMPDEFNKKLLEFLSHSSGNQGNRENPAT